MIKTKQAVYGLLGAVALGSLIWSSLCFKDQYDLQQIGDQYCADGIIDTEHGDCVSDRVHWYYTRLESYAKAQDKAIELLDNNKFNRSGIILITYRDQAINIRKTIFPLLEEIEKRDPRTHVDLIISNKRYRIRTGAKYDT